MCPDNRMQSPGIQERFSGTPGVCVDKIDTEVSCDRFARFCQLYWLKCYMYYLLWSLICCLQQSALYNWIKPCEHSDVYVYAFERLFDQLHD